MKNLLLVLPIMLLAACGQVGTSSLPGTTFAASSDIAPDDVAQAVAWAQARVSFLQAQGGVMRAQQLELSDPELIGKMTSSANCEKVAKRLGSEYYCKGRNLYYEARPMLPNQ
ncbi:hypothetical protein [Deinococcus sp.]|uniref:hypothetical protein n=1 Tax=Deinococcus sp. TaxID=47478 RepID=UPI003C7A5AF3